MRASRASCATEEARRRVHPDRVQRLDRVVRAAGFLLDGPLVLPRQGSTSSLETTLQDTFYFRSTLLVTAVVVEVLYVYV